MGVEAGFARAAAVFILAVAGDRDEGRILQTEFLPHLAGDFEASTPGRLISNNTTSGGLVRASFKALGPSWAVRTSWPKMPRRIARLLKIGKISARKRPTTNPETGI